MLFHFFEVILVESFHYHVIVTCIVKWDNLIFSIDLCVFEFLLIQLAYKILVYKELRMEQSKQQ